MLDIEAVKRCYAEFQDDYSHFEKIDMYYYGNTDEMKVSVPIEGKSKVKVVDNFFQEFVDQEALYSFGNPITYSYADDIDESIADVIKNNTFNRKNHDSSLGQRLIEFGLCYELNFISKKGFKSKIITPMQGNMYFDEYDEPQFFIYVHSKDGIKNYIDVYDDTYVYYLTPSFMEYKPKQKHGFNNRVPVGVGIIGNNKYSIKKGYVEGDKTIYRMIKTNQDAYSQTKSCMTQEIIDFRNAILKTYGIKLRDKLDEEGKVILDSHGQPLKEEPVLNNTKMLHFQDKSKSDAEWLIKNINDTFIQNMLRIYRDDMHTLTCHVDCNEKMQSNLSGQALRARLQGLESKCTENTQAMHEIIKTRIECLFDYLSTIRKGDYDSNKVNIGFSVCVPIDENIISDMISKIPHDVVSNKTKRSWLPKIDNPELEQKIIDKENKAAEPDFNLDNITHAIGGEIDG